MSAKTYQGIALIILAILTALNQGLAWGSLQYLWAILVAVVGIWVLASKS